MSEKVKILKDILDNYESHVEGLVDEDIENKTNIKKFFSKYRIGILHLFFLLVLISVFLFLGLFLYRCTDEVGAGILLVSLALYLICIVIWRYIISKKQRKRVWYYNKYSGLLKDEEYFDKFIICLSRCCPDTVEEIARARRERIEDGYLLKGVVLGMVFWATIILLVYEKYFRNFVSATGHSGLTFSLSLLVVTVLFGLQIKIDKEFIKSSVEKRFLTLLIGDFEDFRIWRDEKNNFEKEEVEKILVKIVEPKIFIEPE